MGDNGAGKSTLVKIIAGQFSAPVLERSKSTAEQVHFHRPIEAREKGIEVVYQDLALCNNLTAAANVFLGREMKRGFGPISWLDARRDVQARGRALRRAQIRDAPAPSRAADVGRAAPGGGDRPHAAVQRQDRADGRADRGDQRAPGRRGARSHPAAARFRHLGRADQPPHAGRLRGLRPHRSCCGAAARSPTRRSRSRARPRKSRASSPAPSMSLDRQIDLQSAAGDVRCRPASTRATRRACGDALREPGVLGDGRARRSSAPS